MSNLGQLFPFSYLFQPQPATSQQQTSPTQLPWLTRMLGIGTALTLAVTDWNSGGVARTIMTCVSWMLQTEDTLISQIAQGGFLDYAATGTVVYINSQGVTVTVPVTLDPSTNPGAPPGFLDALAESVYKVVRIGAVGGSGIEVITNLGSAGGTFATGTYHVLNPVNGLSYSNVSPLTINAGTQAGAGIASIAATTPVIITTNSAHGLAMGSYVSVVGTGTPLDMTNGNSQGNSYAIVVTGTHSFFLVGTTSVGAQGAGGQVWVAQPAEFSADVNGPGVSAPGTINQAVTVVNNITVSNPGTFAGTAAESNTALANRCRLKLAALSPNGAKAAYAYFALSAFQLLAAGGTYNPNGNFNLLSTPITKVLVLPNTATGANQTVVANGSPSGIVSGITDLLVTGASNDSPIVITTAAPHGLITGQIANIAGVNGNTNANGNFQITNLGSVTFSIPAMGNGAYSGGGVIEGGDLGELDALLQQICVPNAVTENTIQATPVGATCGGTIYVTASYASQAVPAVVAALTAYATNLPIGGDNLAFPNVAPYNEILGIAEGALPQIINIAPFFVNGLVLVDVVLGPTGGLSFTAFNFNVVGV